MSIIMYNICYMSLKTYFPLNIGFLTIISFAVPTTKYTELCDN